ncbi:MAG: hypothetical protein J6I64_02745, partial [Lachnospiraceae bacterium]|nr:hypothetical protein [Lachnospiraceae bacterium]
GVNVDSREFGKELMTQKHSSVMYVDEKPDSSLAAVIQKMGCVLRSDDLAVQADARFLRSVGVRAGHRKITVYAISKDATANLRFAKRCLSSLRQCEVAAEQTSLVLLGQDNETVRSLQVTENKYGYGYVTIYQESEMTARLMIQKYPPCDGIEFDETGRATEDFEALVVGFGQTGQAVLRHLIMNGQFVGSTFRAAVFAPDCQSVNGYFSRGLEQVLKNYDIMFCPFDARSREMYDYILERRKTLKYVAVCTGSEQTNQEIAVELAAYFAHLEMDIPICQCSRRGVKRMDQDGTVISYHKLYQSGIIATGALDRMAMIINHHYHIGTEKTALEEWMVCDYFSRMSCRASADFMPAVLRAAGRTTEQAMTGPWDFSEEKLEVLSHMEHLRWCAFHYCMGFSPMDGEEYAVRTEIYQRQLAADGKASIRVGKNMKQRTHACLIGWEKLDELSAYETKITGREIDYKALDQENILVIPELLQAKKKFEEAE